MNLDYHKKALDPLFDDILWNIPEQKTGTVQIIGGNANSFSTEIKSAEFLNRLNLKEVRLLLPDVLRNKIPPIPGINFAPSTESGSFDKSKELEFAASDADITVMLGDFSKNSITSVAMVETIKKTTKPIIITRDAVDSVLNDAEDFIEKGGITFVASMAQLQKLFRSLMYPKMILLSSPLVPVLETLHKFTLSYPVTILTFHQDNIIIANNGNVVTTPIDRTSYSPIGLWGGELACKIAALNLWSPNKPLEATSTAVFYK